MVGRTGHLLSGITPLLGVDRVVQRSLKPVPAIRTAEHAVMAFTLKIVTTYQARNACGDLLASELSI
jgi:hypothetical protein